MRTFSCLPQDGVEYSLTPPQSIKTPLQACLPTLACFDDVRQPYPLMGLMVVNCRTYIKVPGWHAGQQGLETALEAYSRRIQGAATHGLSQPATSISPDH